MLCVSQLDVLIMLDISSRMDTAVGETHNIVRLQSTEEWIYLVGASKTFEFDASFFSGRDCINYHEGSP